MLGAEMIHQKPDKKRNKMTLPGWLVLSGIFPRLSLLFGGPHMKDYSLLGSRLGSPYLSLLQHLLSLTATLCAWGFSAIPGERGPGPPGRIGLLGFQNLPAQL